MERYAFELLQKEKRIDGRKFDEFRPIEIKENVIETAEGSAHVKLGETEIIVGVKLNIGEPFSDTPEEGVLIVNAEFNPLASPDFEAGPPGEDAVELARLVDRGIRESKCIDVSKLCIVPKEKVWMVFIDVDIINHRGNLLDCAALGAITALLNARIPKVEDDKILRGEYTKKLPIAFKPINVTVGKFGDKYLLDPNLEEETIIESKLSVSTREDGKVCALQKQGTKGLDISDIGKMVSLAMEKGKELRKLLK